MRIDNYQKLFPPNDIQMDSLKNNIKFALKLTLNVNFNTNLKLFLRLYNCLSVGGKKL
jgi:hypothetical protein